MPEREFNITRCTILARCIRRVPIKKHCFLICLGFLVSPARRKGPIVDVGIIRFRKEVTVNKVPGVRFCRRPMDARW